MPILAGSVLASYQITLSAASEIPVSVQWRTEGDSAVAGIDFQQADGTLTFEPGETIKYVKVLVYGQESGTADKTFNIILSHPTNAFAPLVTIPCVIRTGEIDTNGYPSVRVIVPMGDQGPAGEKGAPGNGWHGPFLARGVVGAFVCKVSPDGTIFGVEPINTSSPVRSNHLPFFGRAESNALHFVGSGGWALDSISASAAGRKKLFSQNLPFMSREANAIAFMVSSNGKLIEIAPGTPEAPPMIRLPNFGRKSNDRLIVAYADGGSRGIDMPVPSAMRLPFVDRAQSQSSMVFNTFSNGGASEMPISPVGAWRGPHLTRMKSFISAKIGMAGSLIDGKTIRQNVMQGWRGPYMGRSSKFPLAFFFHDDGKISPLSRAAETQTGDPYVEAVAGPCRVVAGDLVHVGPSGEETIDASPFSFDSAYPVGPSFLASWDKPLVGAKSRVRVSRDGKTWVPDDPDHTILALATGQSLSAGSRGTPPISTTPEYPEHVMMFDTGAGSDVRGGRNTSDGVATVYDPAQLVGYLPLVAAERGVSGQTPLESLANGLHRRARDLGARPRIVAFSAGEGGWTYEPAAGDTLGESGGIKKGTITYNNMLGLIQRARDLEVAAGRRLIIPAIYHRHGESDVSKASYGAWMAEFQANLSADLRALLGQALDIPLLMAQPSSFASLMSDTFANSVRGMLAAFISQPSKIVVTHPSYMLPHDGDNLHLSPAGYFLDGEYALKAYLSALGPTPWKPLYMTSASLSGASIVTTWSNPTGSPLVFDTATVTERAGTFRGFEYRDDAASPPAIVDAAIVSATRVDFLLASSPTGSPASRQLRCAMRGHASTPRLADERPRANLRDSDPAKSQLDGRHLYNWAVHQQMGVT